MATKSGKECKILTCMSFNTCTKYNLGSDALNLIFDDSKSKIHQTEIFYNKDSQTNRKANSGSSDFYFA